MTSLSYSQYQHPPISVEDKIYDYVDGVKEAVKTKKTLVVYVGCTPQHLLKNVIIARHHFLQDYPAQCIIVAFPDDKWVNHHKTLPIYASSSELNQAIIQVVQPIQRIQQSTQINWGNECRT